MWMLWLSSGAPTDKKLYMYLFMYLYLNAFFVVIWHYVNKIDLACCVSVEAN